MQNVAYAPISDINFNARATKRRRILEGQSGHQSQPELLEPPPPSKENIESFLHLLSKTGKPAQLSILPDYCDEYVVDHSVLSPPLHSLFEASAMNFTAKNMNLS